MRPAASLLDLARRVEPRLRRALLWAGLAWLAFVSLAAAGLAALVAAFDGPWWAFLLVGLVAVALLAPYVFLAVMAMGVFELWRGRVETAADVERWWTQRPRP